MQAGVSRSDKTKTIIFEAMKREIILMAFGKYAYGWMAYNLAVTIKKHSPDIPITLVYEKSAVAQNDLWPFDRVVEIQQDHLYQNGKFNPGRAKTRIIEYIQADYAMYLDVDSLVVKPLEPLFEACEKSGKYYQTQVVGKQQPKQGAEFPEMQWANLDEVESHYKIANDAWVYATNSSFAFIKKGKESAALFKQIQANIDNPCKIKLDWGQTFPDELALNVALAQVNHDPTIEGIVPVYFNSGGGIANMSAVIDQYYILGYYGGVGFTTPALWEFYDREMRRVLNERGMEHSFKSHLVTKHKHANKRSL